MIRLELERAGHRDRFALKTYWAVEPLDLLRELRRRRPAVLHASGRAGRGVSGLSFHGADGRVRSVATVALEKAFGAAGASVELVVLSACYSDAHAEARGGAGSDSRGRDHPSHAGPDAAGCLLARPCHKPEQPERGSQRARPTRRGAGSDPGGRDQLSHTGSGAAGRLLALPRRESEKPGQHAQRARQARGGWQRPRRS